MLDTKEFQGGVTHVGVSFDTSHGILIGDKLGVTFWVVLAHVFVNKI